MEAEEVEPGTLAAGGAAGAVRGAKENGTAEEKPASGAEEDCAAEADDAPAGANEKAPDDEKPEAAAGDDCALEAADEGATAANENGMDEENPEDGAAAGALEAAVLMDPNGNGAAVANPLCGTAAVSAEGSAVDCMEATEEDADALVPTRATLLDLAGKIALRSGMTVKSVMSVGWTAVGSAASFWATCTRACLDS